ncbi:MAG: orotate phosphoribosyltransferase [Methylococcales bacterium]
MQDYQSEFIRFALDCEALQFGQFSLKSGRISPYFFNGGQFNSGEKLARLGGFYAHALIAANISVDILFGPAYKGIPLVCALSIALAKHHQIDLPYAFNRKEVKDHGEGGQLVGAPLQGNALIVDDVITAGTSVNESIQIFKQSQATACGVLIALDRQERLENSQSAIQMIEDTYKIPVISIINFSHIAKFVSNLNEFSDYQQQILEYRQQFGIN